MTIDELKAKLKADHKVDLDEIIGKASKFDEANEKAQRADAVRTALKAGGIELSEDGSGDDLVAAVETLVADRTDLSGKVTSLSERIDQMDKAAKKERAETLVRPYAKAGLVPEADRPAMIELAESNYDLASNVLKGLSKGVLLSEELGSEYSDDPPASTSTDLSEDDAAEVARLAEEAKKLTASTA